MAGWCVELCLAVVLGNSECAEPSAFPRKSREEDDGDQSLEDPGGRMALQLRMQASKAAACDFATCYVTFEPLGR